MNKHLLLMAVAGSILLSSCDVEKLISGNPDVSNVYYSFTKEALEHCGSFRDSIHKSTVLSELKYGNATVQKINIIAKREGLFIGEKDADGKREVIQYSNIDWTLPESHPMSVEKVGTYVKKAYAPSHNSGDWKYEIEIKCKNTGKTFTATHTAPGGKNHAYSIDVKDGQVTIDFRVLPSESEMFKVLEDSPKEKIKYYVKELYPINIP